MRCSYSITVPKYIFYIEEGDIPKTASGKIQKFKLKERAMELLKNEEASMVAGGK